MEKSLEPILGKLTSSIVQEFTLSWDVEEELENLLIVRSTLKSMFQDAEEEQFHSNQLRHWMRRVKDAAYEADDLLDEFATEALRFKVEEEIQSTSKRNLVRRICCSCFTSNPILFRHETAHKIKEIHERLERISKQPEDFHVRHEGYGGVSGLQIRERPNTISLIHESDVLGREYDKEKLINLLVSDGSVAKELSVIPIVGMGGVGKTTLAQLIYNDESIEKHFDLRGWVCVSNDFDLERLSKAIIESTSKTSSNYGELTSLTDEIKKIVSEKKFLLVLDDVWNEDSKKWEVLRAPLRCGAKGSKILVTTRSENVSRIMGTTLGYPLRILSDEYCWLLLGKWAFPTESWDEHPDLVVVGKKIAKKCRGIPLAAKTLGGLLHGTRKERNWADILESEIWEQGGEDILNSLKLSYHHLPSHLKQCFLYCSIFPKGYEFEKEELVKLWMAEGFITSELGHREIEDVGCDYFDDLLQRSFFQYEKEENSKLIYKMHDLIHDLAQSVSEGECFRMEDDRLIHFSTKARYSSCLTYKENDLTIFEPFYKCKRLHSFLVFQRVQTESVLSNIFLRLKFLRVLHLKIVEGIKELPDSIGNLKHLRHFALSSDVIKRLPKSTSSLYNLQTLDLNYCRELVELPKDTRNLINLRHLTFPTYYMSSTPKGIGGLTCLQTLSGFIVGKKSGHEIGQLMKLINLRGRLQITGLENVLNAEEVEWKNTQDIEELNLSWRLGDCDNSVLEEVFERLKPHPNYLRLLIINGYYGQRFPSWITDPSFSRLEKVVIRGCKPMLPPLWQLPSLKILEILNSMIFVDGVGTEEGHFSCLHTLKLWNCDKEMLRSLSHFTSLSSLEICDIESLDVLPGWSFENLEGLKTFSIFDCKKLVSLVEDDEDFKHLHSLEHLDISICPQLAYLPDGLTKLASLKELYIYDCERLATLPEEGLPITLQSLRIHRCPLLAEQCQPATGKYWPMISHIPNLSF